MFSSHRALTSAPGSSSWFICSPSTCGTFPSPHQEKKTKQPNLSQFCIEVKAFLAFQSWVKQKGCHFYIDETLYQLFILLIMNLQFTSPDYLLYRLNLLLLCSYVSLFLCLSAPIRFSSLIWLEQVANNARVVGLIPLWAIHLGVGLDDPCESLPTQSIL